MIVCLHYVKYTKGCGFSNLSYFFTHSTQISDIEITWNRLFNHRSFTQGEIQQTLREFEVSTNRGYVVFVLHKICFSVLQQNRKDREVFDLLYTIENISEIRDFELNCFLSNSKKITPEINLQLQRLVDLCEKIPQLEKRDFKEVSFGDVAFFLYYVFYCFIESLVARKQGKT